MKDQENYLKQPSAAQFRTESFIALLAVVVPTLGTAGAIALAASHGMYETDWILFLVMYAISGLGVSVGFHRLFTHRSFETGPVVRAALAIAGSFAFQGPVIRWAADHRRHHKYEDTEGDPHSPVAPPSDSSPVSHPFWHAHIGWFWNRYQTRVRKFVPDLLDDPLVTKIDRYYLLWLSLSFLLPLAIGWFVHGPMGGLSAFLWAGLARVFLLHHATWCVNSVCHIYGTRPFKRKDTSVNNVIVALLTFGEGWHNNHHAFPTSAFLGLRPWQIDFGNMTLRVMQVLGLARNLKRPREILQRAKAPRTDAQASL